MKVSNKIYSIFVGLFLVFGMSACQQESAVKRDQPAPPVSNDFIPDGHILSKSKLEEEISDSASIPSLVQTEIPQLPPLGSNDSTSNTYSVSAVGVPVSDLLFKIAQDAGKEIDIYSGVSGSVTINALNQPLDKILDRMSDQASFVYDVDGNTILIKPDYPEWRNYKVNYVNIKKTSNESIDMQMSVSSGVESSGGSGGTPASSTKVQVSSENDFWTRLEENIKLLAQLDPNSNKVLLPEGSEKGKAVELSNISQNTVVNGEAGIISVYTTIKQHKAIKKYITEVTKRAEQQVLIEATVVEVELNDDYQTGIDWSAMNGMFGSDGGLQFSSPFSGPDGGFSISTIDSSGASAAIGEFNVLANIQLLKQFGDSKVLSSPKIMAVNNQTALLKVVENLVYFTVEVNTSSTTSNTITTYETEVHTLPVGFTMSVTPFVSEDEEITLNVRPTITKQIGFVLDPNPSLTNIESRIPVVQEKEMSSVLRLRNKQTAIIGGLIEDSNSSGRSGLPWVSDVPFVGDLFSKRDEATKKRELIIFIRPVIIKNPDVDNGDLTSVSRFLKKTKNY
jgi:general secretion pathway protein D